MLEVAMTNMIQKIKLNGERVLITSDVHGNLPLLKKALNEMNFDSEDILIINGDISEKGLESINLFNYLIELKKQHQVYFTMGNCDHLINHFADESKNEGMSEYMNTRTHTFLSEIATAMGGNPSYLERVAYAQKYHQDIIDLVASMPIVIETDAFYCVHAALHEDGTIDRPYNISHRDFYRADLKFDKPVIVGHYPVCLYSDDEINHNTRFDTEKNIIATDGGNMMKALGQLNVVIYQDGEFSFEAFDLLETVPAPHDQKGRKGVYINWANKGIEVINEGTIMSDVYHPYSDNTVSVDNHFLDLKAGTLVKDTTDALVEVSKGDPITIYFERDHAYYIKCNGYVGWYLK